MRKRSAVVRRTAGEAKSPGWPYQVSRGVLTALLMTAVLIMIYSFLIKSLNIPDAWFKPINIVTKMAAAFLAAFLASRRMPGFAWAFGALAGVLYTLSGYMLFSLLDRAFGPVAILLGDTVMGAIVGFAAGILTRMLPEKRMAKR